LTSSSKRYQSELPCSNLQNLNLISTFNPFLDGSLSDTAVGLTGIDRRGKQMDQRSPKSETPTRDRDRFGASSGMGKKSNSTSQLSATGNLSKSLSIPLSRYFL
jgi:hypothetical protein